MTLEEIEKELDVILSLAPIEENCVCMACRAKRLCQLLISEVKRLRGAIQSVLHQKHLISYAIQKELREALEEKKQEPPCL